MDRKRFRYLKYLDIFNICPIISAGTSYIRNVFAKVNNVSVLPLQK